LAQQGIGAGQHCPVSDNERKKYLQITEDALDQQEQNAIFLDPTPNPTRWPTRDVDDDGYVSDFTDKAVSGGMGVGAVVGIVLGGLLAVTGVIFVMKSQREVAAPAKRKAKVANPVFNPNTRTL
jgi:hypothetical protein